MIVHPERNEAVRVFMCREAVSFQAVPVPFQKHDRSRCHTVSTYLLFGCSVSYSVESTCTADSCLTGSLINT